MEKIQPALLDLVTVVLGEVGSSGVCGKLWGRQSHRRDLGSLAVGEAFQEVFNLNTLELILTYFPH